MSITTGQVNINVQATPTKTITAAVQTGSAQGRVNESWSIAAGTVLDKADEMYSVTTTIAGSSDETLDLSILEDAFGDVIVFARIKAIVIVNESEDNSINVGGAASEAWEGWITAAGEVIIPASTATNKSWFALSIPQAVAYAVVDNTSDKLLITNNGATATDVTVMIIGSSA